MPNPSDSKDNSKYDENHSVRAGNFSIKTSKVWDWIKLRICEGSVFTAIATAFDSVCGCLMENGCFTHSLH